MARVGGRAVVEKCRDLSNGVKAELIRLGVRLHVSIKEREPGFWLEQQAEEDGYLSLTKDEKRSLRDGISFSTRHKFEVFMGNPSGYIQ